jgi:hypothetical protein
MQSFDVGVGVPAVARRRPHAGNHQTDVVVVVQRADRDSGQFGDGADRLGVHTVDYGP